MDDDQIQDADVYIDPPGDGALSDGDSGDEECNNPDILNRHQLLAPAELVLNHDQNEDSDENNDEQIPGTSTQVYRFKRHFDYRLDSKDNIWAVTWHDNSVVTLLSNEYGVYPFRKAQRYSVAARRRIDIDQPNLVHQYNKYMGGVDRLDSNIGVYRIAKRDVSSLDEFETCSIEHYDQTNMGQQSSRKRSECVCGCGYERRRYECAGSSGGGGGAGSVQRYVSAVTGRLAGRACVCRDKRLPACVCTNYTESRLTAVLTLGSRELRRELDAIVLNADGEAREPPHAPEFYVLSVAPRSADEEPGDGSGPDSQLGSDRLRPHIQVRQVASSELRALLLSSPTPPSPLLARVHTQVDYIHCLVPDLQKITACSFYWGKMDRYEAERLLDNKPEGTFLLRDSAQEEHLFSVSFRKYGRSLHARIEHYDHKFSFDSHDPAVYCARTVTGLIEHYKDPSCVMFFEPMLTAPLPRAEPFSLQQLARAAIVSHTTYDGVDKLPLPPRLRCYLKEYHYRQRVRVRSLDHHAHGGTYHL